MVQEPGAVEPDRVDDLLRDRGRDGPDLVTADQVGGDRLSRGADLVELLHQQSVLVGAGETGEERLGDVRGFGHATLGELVEGRQRLLVERDVGLHRAVPGRRRRVPQEPQHEPDQVQVRPQRHVER
ncbi:hypothetical protein GCM10027067_18040 [Pseudactinotalea suaedae]